MALQKAMVSSKSNEWVTPQDLFDELDKEFNFTLDPCSTIQNHKCDHFFTAQDDGLSKSWQYHRVFMNPPYGGHTGDWIKKAYEETKNAEHWTPTKVVCLIVSSTDRSYWHEYIFPYAAQIRFIRGRLHFNNSKSSAPFASAIVIFDNYREYKDKIVYDKRIDK
jgi:site-specific DNA-methyltransferase (adenine-specific)